MSIQYRADLVGGNRPAPVLTVAGLDDSKFFYQRIAKRALDVVLVLIVSLPVLTLVAILALAVAMDGHNPFYRQIRLGRNGRRFSMWKLRSMVCDAEAALVAHLAADPAARVEWDRDQKLRNDPRVTPVGRLIRRTSLDELPQLWNVLRGDMSLVGPRPMMPEQEEIYPGTEYFRMRPGLTGFWQISERNETSFGERASYDRAYWSEMSLATDLRVMLRTVGVVMRATGH